MCFRVRCTPPNVPIRIYHDTKRGKRRACIKILSNPFQATEADALAAILLFEESVTLQSGISHLDVLPLHHLVAPESTPEEAFDAEAWLGAGNELIIARLAERVKDILERVPNVELGNDY